MGKTPSQIAATVAMDAMFLFLTIDFCYNGNVFAEWIVRGFASILFFGVLLAAWKNHPRPRWSKHFFAYHIATDVAIMIPLVLSGHYGLAAMWCSMDVMILLSPAKQTAQRNEGGE
jgi:hypothetical protein